MTAKSVLGRVCLSFHLSVCRYVTYYTVLINLFLTSALEDATVGYEKGIEDTTEKQNSKLNSQREVSHI